MITKISGKITGFEILIKTLLSKQYWDFEKYFSNEIKQI
jgi:hypothetical protein